MKASRSKSAVPLRVKAALVKLGEDISVARRRRELPISVVAERAFVSRNTIARVERGDVGVAVGTYATVLFVLGLEGRLADLADPLADEVGMALGTYRLPKRVRISKGRG